MRTPKTGIAALAALTTVALTTAAYAATFTHTGTVRQITVHNSATVATFRDWFQLNGLTSASGCNVHQGFVLIKLPARNTDEYKAMMALLTAAKAGGRQVFVDFTNEVISENFCTVRALSLAP
jgi:hypothetical protein